MLGCKDFGTPAATLARAGRDDGDRMEGLLREAVVQLEPHTLEWLAEGAESPAGYLTSKVRRAHSEQW